MPQQTQHSLVYVLLMWTTLNTIIQVIFITLFFTVGRNQPSLNPSINSSAIEPMHNMQSQYPSNDGFLLGRGKMITFQATKASDTIEWMTPSQDTSVISEKGKALQIKMDGYCFLSLRVTLYDSIKENDSCELNHTVKLKLDNKDLLMGWINPITRSTGLLGRVLGLYAGGELTVNIDPPTRCVNTSESVTHLDIIFMDTKP